MLEILFFILSALALVGTGFFLLSKREDYAVMSLTLVFASLGGIFALLGHSFLGAIQLLVYAGAIVVAFLFVVWIVKGRAKEGRSLLPIAISFAAALFIELAILFISIKDKIFPTSFPAKSLGNFLLGDFLYLFELISVVIVTGIIASLVLVRREK